MKPSACGDQCHVMHDTRRLLCVTQRHGQQHRCLMARAAAGELYNTFKIQIHHPHIWAQANGADSVSCNLQLVALMISQSKLTTCYAYAFRGTVSGAAAAWSRRRAALVRPSRAVFITNHACGSVSGTCCLVHRFGMPNTLNTNFILIKHLSRAQHAFTCYMSSTAKPFQRSSSSMPLALSWLLVCCWCSP